MKLIKKAFECTSPKPWFGTEYSEIFHAETRSKARYQAKLHWDIDNPYWIDIKVRRYPASDLFEPKPDEILSELTDEQKKIIAHANGNGKKDPGYRDHYHCRNDDPDLLKLVSKGLMNGPQKNRLFQEDHGYFFLTDKGKQAAYSMLPRLRGK